MNFITEQFFLKNIIMSDNKFIIWDTTGKPWFKSDRIEDSKKINKTKTVVKNEPKCVHLIFEEMSKNISDPFWKNLFIDIATNNPKRGFSYSPNLHPDSCNVGKLVYKSRGKEYLCDVNSDPKISVMNVKKFMTEKANLMSDYDKEIKNNELNNELMEKSKIEINNWNDIKNDKKIYITNYIDKMVKKYSLTPSEKNNLINLINEGIASGILDNNKIIVYKNEIIDIKGLQQTNNLFYLDPNIKVVYSIKNSKATKDDTENSNDTDYEQDYNSKNLTLKYKKFLKELNKKYEAL